MKQLLPHLQLLDDRQDLMLSQVVDLCDANSSTCNLDGLEVVAQKLAKMFEDLGGQLQLVDSDLDSQLNDQGELVDSPLGKSIHIVKRPNAKHKVLLCIHMDTVYPVDNPFQECVMRDDGTLNGPGVADAKGGIVVMLHALQTLEASPLAEHIGWEVLLNPDEEIGSPGSLGLIESIAKRCDFGLLFEPALGENQLVSWRKGSGNFSVLVRGRSAHAGRAFAEGRNALIAAAKVAQAINDLNTDPEVTFNVSRIDGGSPTNVVPDLAIARVNVRVRTAEAQAKVEQQLDEVLETFGQLDGIDVSLHGGFRSPPKPITPEMETVMKRIEKCGAALDVDIQWNGTGGACDGNKFAAMGLPNIDSMGPCGGRIHSDEEFLIVESLVPRAKLSALVLLDFAQQTADSSA